MIGLAVVGFIGMIVLNSILRGWVLSILWKWFMVSIFELPALGIAPAIGISLVINYLTQQYIDAAPDTSKSEGRKLTEACIKGVITPFAILLMGWIVHLFM